MRILTSTIISMVIDSLTPVRLLVRWRTGLASRLLQVGIRTMNDHQRLQADRFGVEVVTMERLDADNVLSIRWSSLPFARPGRP